MILIIQLIRHATLFLEIEGKKILVDPMLSPKGAMDPAQNAENNHRNPLVDLPTNIPDLELIDAVIVTHSHRDHFDEGAVRLLPHNRPLFCQPEDEQKYRELRFVDVRPVFDSLVWENIRVTRTYGEHGKGEMIQKMGPVSGFVLQTENEPTLYIAGDTVWCSHVQNALNKYKPSVTILFSGAAQFLNGGPITMTVEDIDRVCRTLPGTQVIVAHMEAWNHCLLTRQELQLFLQKEGLSRQVNIPEDGEWIEYK